uniref:Uncharacterized protein n=1 Tax=Opuntia streptacantha TaxID=393608 RepID=A0A7C8YRD5_OPUST
MSSIVRCNPVRSRKNIILVFAPLGKAAQVKFFRRKHGILTSTTNNRHHHFTACLPCITHAGLTTVPNFGIIASSCTKVGNNSCVDAAKYIGFIGFFVYSIANQ